MHIAIFGCGQLAQMTAQAGIALGLRFSFIAEPGEDTRCVNDLGAIVTYTPHLSAQDLFFALQQPDVITVEKEMVNTTLLEELQGFTTVFPAGNAIHIAQNRIREKTFLRELGIPTADFEIISAIEQLHNLPERLGFPIYIKAAESGYDGYHQWRIKTTADLSQPSLLDAIHQGVTLIAEKHVNYLREVSVIAARNAQGECVFYPLMENRHEDGVLIATIAPAPHASCEATALLYMKKVVSELNYVGILTMECFETAEGIVANELAPRVHNSGHWTIEGCDTSQFENHCRAITGMALGSTNMHGVAGLVNMLGKHGDEAALTQSTTFYHRYGKEERARRKLGHVTVCAQDLATLKQSLNHILTTLYGSYYLPLQ
jgi:5-(carboxyamino)imidazole ribonucleotide synthase